MVEEKSYEIIAIPKLLKQNPSQGAVVIIEAGTYTAIAYQIKVASGNYVLVIKDNGNSS